jgi:predicted 3-demethylubiquinone-9 3-methyltransferase (glyoxalase superfamily)
MSYATRNQGHGTSRATRPSSAAADAMMQMTKIDIAAIEAASLHENLPV